MTQRDPDDHAAVVALLERKLDAISPRDADPVRSVVRRARARRRRVLATACAAVLVVGGVVGGALTTGQGIGTFRTTPADGGTPTGAADGTNMRATQPWSGEVVAFHGLVLPVPDGWTVRRSTDPAETCRGAAPKTLWLIEVPEGGVPFHGGCVRPGASDDQVWAVTGSSAGGSLGGANPLAMDPSGQPVWMPDLRPPSPMYSGLGFPWLGLDVDTAGLTDDELSTYLAEVAANPATPHPGLTIPESVRSASYMRFGDDSRSAPRANGGLDVAAVEDVLATARPDNTLRCVPRVGADILLSPPDSTLPVHVDFDTTGTCDQVTDSEGGLATLDPDALRTLAEMVHAPGAD